MHPHWWGPHAWDWMWIVPLGLVVIFVLVLGAYLMRDSWWFFGRSNRRILHEAALEILDRRYAGGNITREQYAQKKRAFSG